MLIILVIQKYLTQTLGQSQPMFEVKLNIVETEIRTKCIP